jgi:hypothetical protein
MMLLPWHLLPPHMHALKACDWLTRQRHPDNACCVNIHGCNNFAMVRPKSPHLVQKALLVVDVAARGATTLRRRNAPSGITVTS